jgi:hypothetical protein
VAPVNGSWQASVAITILGAGLLLAIPVAWLLRRREGVAHGDLYIAVLGILAVGAVAWGARLGDFTMFYLYFAGIAVFATALAAVAVREVWVRLSSTGRRLLAVGVIAACILQFELGVESGLARLQGFGQSGQAPIALPLLASIRELPADAKLAYSCGPFDEIAIGTQQLLSIDAHTGRRVVPMCFVAEFPDTLLGAPMSANVASQFFRGSPQASLYPDADTVPPTAAIAAFLRQHGIDYVYADRKHPNTLMTDATVVARSGDAEVLKVP